MPSWRWHCSQYSGQLWSLLACKTSHPQSQFPRLGADFDKGSSLSSPAAPSAKSGQRPILPGPGQGLGVAGDPGHLSGGPGGSQELRGPPAPAQPPLLSLAAGAGGHLLPHIRAPTPALHTARLLHLLPATFQVLLGPRQHGDPLHRFWPGPIGLSAAVSSDTGVYRQAAQVVKTIALGLTGNRRLALPPDPQVKRLNKENQV